jgi:hypothetical protein
LRIGIGRDPGLVGCVIVSDVLVVAEEQITMHEDGEVSDIGTRDHLLDSRPHVGVQGKILSFAVRPHTHYRSIALHAELPFVIPSAAALLVVRSCCLSEAVDLLDGCHRPLGRPHMLVHHLPRPGGPRAARLFVPVGVQHNQVV